MGPSNEMKIEDGLSERGVPNDISKMALVPFKRPEGKVTVGGESESVSSKVVFSARKRCLSVGKMGLKAASTVFHPKVRRTTVVVAKLCIEGVATVCCKGSLKGESTKRRRGELGGSTTSSNQDLGLN